MMLLLLVIAVLLIFLWFSPIAEQFCPCRKGDPGPPRDILNPFYDEPCYRSITPITHGAVGDAAEKST